MREEPTLPQETENNGIQIIGASLRRCWNNVLKIGTYIELNIAINVSCDAADDSRVRLVSCIQRAHIRCKPPEIGCVIVAAVKVGNETLTKKAVGLLEGSVKIGQDESIVGIEERLICAIEIDFKDHIVLRCISETVHIG